MADLVSGVDVVFHLAARPGVRGHHRNLTEMRHRDNVVATRNLLSVTPKETAVVATSSSSVYGGSLGGFASHELGPLRPRGEYARSKLEMERLCRLHRDRGAPVAIIRPFTVAGEGQRSDMAFSLWLDALRRGNPIRIFGCEKRARDITDVRDVVEGLIRAGERNIDDVVDLGTGVTHRLIDLARVLMAVTRRDADIVVEPGSREEASVTRADTGRCSELLGFVPRTLLHDLLARQVEAALAAPAMA